MLLFIVCCQTPVSASAFHLNPCLSLGSSSFAHPRHYTHSRSLTHELRFPAIGSQH